MSSWWRRYAETRNLTLPATGGGSWKRIVAMHYLYNAPPQTASGPWPKILAQNVVAGGSPGLDTSGNGSWTKRLIDADNAQTSGSAARQMALSGARAPMD